MKGLCTLGMCLLFGLPVACSDNDSDKDGGVKDQGGDKAPDPDVNCTFPPLSRCESPGTRPICPNNWYCPGCSCSGPQKAAACSVLTNDCRWFCTGCIPDGYMYCSPDAPSTILGRCDYCFFDQDGGVSGEVRPECDLLDEILDAKTGPQDAGTDATDATDATK